MFRAAMDIASARNVLFIGPLRSPCPRWAQRRMTVKEPSADETLQAQGMKWFTPHCCGAMQRVWRISKNAPLPSRTIGPWSDAIPCFRLAG